MGLFKFISNILGDVKDAGTHLAKQVPVVGHLLSEAVDIPLSSTQHFIKNPLKTIANAASGAAAGFAAGGPVGAFAGGVAGADINPNERFKPLKAALKGAEYGGAASLTGQGINYLAPETIPATYITSPFLSKPGPSSAVNNAGSSFIPDNVSELFSKGADYAGSTAGSSSIPNNGSGLFSEGADYAGSNAGGSSMLDKASGLFSKGADYAGSLASKSADWIMKNPAKAALLGLTVKNVLTPAPKIDTGAEPTGGGPAAAGNKAAQDALTAAKARWATSSQTLAQGPAALTAMNPFGIQKTMDTGYNNKSIAEVLQETRNQPSPLPGATTTSAVPAAPEPGRTGGTTPLSMSSARQAVAQEGGMPMPESVQPNMESARTAYMRGIANIQPPGQPMSNQNTQSRILTHADTEYLEYLQSRGLI